MFQDSEFHEKWKTNWKQGCFLVASEVPKAKYILNPKGRGNLFDENLNSIPFYLIFWLMYVLTVYYSNLLQILLQKRKGHSIAKQWK